MSNGDRSNRGRRDFVGKIRSVKYGCHSGFNEDNFRRSGYYDSYNNRNERRIPSLLENFPRVPCHNSYTQLDSTGNLPRVQALLPTPTEPYVNVFNHIGSRDNQLTIASNIISRLLAQSNLPKPVEPQRRTLLPQPAVSNTIKYNSNTVNYSNSYKEIQSRAAANTPCLDEFELKKESSSQQSGSKEEMMAIPDPEVPKNVSPTVVQKSTYKSQRSCHSSESSSSNVAEVSPSSTPRSPDNPCVSAEIEVVLDSEAAFIEEKVIDESTPELNEEVKSSVDAEPLLDQLVFNPNTKPVMERNATPYDNIAAEYLYCHICVKRMKDGSCFSNHIQSRGHQMLLESFVKNYEIQTELLRHNAQIEEQRRGLYVEHMERLGKVINPHHEYCPMCDIRFYGNLVVHRKSAHHQKLKRFLHPNCIVCDKEFSSRIDRDYHRLSVEHLRALEAMEEDVVYSDNDDEDHTSELLMEDKHWKKEGQKKSCSFSAPLGDYNADEVVGYSAVKRITAFYCRICRKYFSNEAHIFDIHCKSREHFEKYSKMVVAQENSDDGITNLESMVCEPLDSVTEEPT